jgi:hypothetical protein
LLTTPNQSNETVRPNGILIASTPRGGRISGASSIVQLDSWNWQGALMKENDGIHLNFPSSLIEMDGGLNQPLLI